MANMKQRMSIFIVNFFKLDSVQLLHSPPGTSLPDDLDAGRENNNLCLFTLVLFCLVLLCFFGLVLYWIQSS